MFRARSKARFRICRSSRWPRRKATRGAGRNELDAGGRRRQDRERWNDWGIGLLLQGDLKGAEYAFRKVTEAEPGYADGWLNVARALIQEGETDAAKPFIQKALAINPKLGRIYFFKALIEKADGDYDGALASLRTVESMYPRDRVVLNQMARILFLKRQYAEAHRSAGARLRRSIPEDLQMHYTMMLCYRGLGRPRESGARGSNCSGASRPRNPRNRLPPNAAWSVRKITTSASRFTITRAWQSHGGVPVRDPLWNRHPCLCVFYLRRHQAGGHALLSSGPLHRRHRAGRHQVHPQQRPGRQEISAGDARLRLRLLRRRRRRLARYPAGQQQRLDSARPQSR